MSIILLSFNESTSSMYQNAMVKDIAIFFIFRQKFRYEVSLMPLKKQVNQKSTKVHSHIKFDFVLSVWKQV